MIRLLRTSHIHMFLSKKHSLRVYVIFWRVNLFVMRYMMKASLNCILTRSNQVFIRLLALIALIISHDYKTALAETFQPLPPAGQGLYDANGTLIGRVVAPGVVQRQINGSWVAFLAGSRGFAANIDEGPFPLSLDGALIYNQKNCKGTAYLNVVINDVGIGSIYPNIDGSPQLGIIVGDQFVSKTLSISGVFRSPYYYAAATLFYPGKLERIIIKSVAKIGIDGTLKQCNEIAKLTPYYAGKAYTTKLGPYITPFYVK